MISYKTFGSALGVLVSVALISLASEESPTTRISVMSYNIENGGAQVDFNKTVEAIKKSGADVVGIQEAWGNTAPLAKAVGWKYYDQRQHIISRFPLFEAPDSHGLYTFIEVLPGKMVAMANMHLPDEPYGPDMVRSGSTAAAVEERSACQRPCRSLKSLPLLQKKVFPFFSPAISTLPPTLTGPNQQSACCKTIAMSWNGLSPSSSKRRESSILSGKPTLTLRKIPYTRGHQGVRSWRTA